jgi:WhiB family transcriptional regulator, redox-sensing transcriptional regulator
MWASDWSSQAACRNGDPDALFVQGAAQNRAKAVCMGCPVRAECLADALDNRIEFGVWGGMTERERRALLRRRPDVDSWRVLLQSAQERHDQGLGDLGDTASLTGRGTSATRPASRRPAAAQGGTLVDLRDRSRNVS